MDIVSFQTAKRLKEAGFKQPDFATGQFWYNEFGALTLIGKKEVSDDGKSVSFFCHALSTGRTDVMRVFHSDGTYFAPSATDIMLELYGCKLGISEDGKFHVTSPVYWDVDGDGDMGYSGGDTISEHENPAECAAMAWLFYNKKV